MALLGSLFGAILAWNIIPPSVSKICAILKLILFINSAENRPTPDQTTENKDDSQSPVQNKPLKPVPTWQMVIF